MKNKILALALCLSPLAPAAFADVTLYGSLRGDIEYDHYGTYGTNSPAANGHARVVDSISRIGFKGEDRWDNGWTGLWQIESALASAGTADVNGANPKGYGGSTWGGRNSYIGFSSPTYGIFRAGNYDTGYKSMLIMSRLSPVFDDFLDSFDYKGKNATFSQLSTRLNDSLSWDTPVWNGLQFRSNYGMDGSPTAAGRAPVYVVSALYNHAGFNAGLGWQYARNRTFTQLSGLASADSQVVSSSSSGNVTPGARTEGAQLVASYTFAAGYALGAGWEHIDNVDPTTHNSHWNNFVLSGNVWLTPKLELQGLYSQSHDILGVSGLTGQQYSLALVDYLSKKTRVYLSGVTLRNGGETTGQQFVFQNASGSLVAHNGQTVAALLTGVRTDF